MNNFYLSSGRNPDRRPVIQSACEPSDAQILSVPRVGNTQREQVVTHLTVLLERGYISPEVHDARVTLALKAADESQLKSLIRDLPPLLDNRKKRDILFSDFPDAGAFMRGALVVIPGIILAIVAPAITATVAHGYGHASPLLMAFGDGGAVFGILTAFTGSVWAVFWHERERKRRNGTL